MRGGQWTGVGRNKRQVYGYQNAVGKGLGAMPNVVGWMARSLKLTTGTSWCQNFFPVGTFGSRTEEMLRTGTSGMRDTKREDGTMMKERKCKVNAEMGKRTQEKQNVIPVEFVWKPKARKEEC